jgi:GNAT superfamily N-acetyltransferase
MQDHSGSQTPTPPPSAQPAAGPGAMSGVSPGGTLPASLAKSAIALRSATPADAEFCYRLHKAAMGDYITATWGWDEQVQRTFHDRAFNPHRWQIITAGQASIGMLDIDYRPGEIYLSRIEIDPGHQRLGIGSRIIRALLEDNLPPCGRPPWSIFYRSGRKSDRRLGAAAVPACRVDDGAPMILLCVGLVVMQVGGVWIGFG